MKKHCPVSFESPRQTVILSILTILILSVSTIVIMTVISKMPIVTLALSQSQVGQVDFAISINNSRVNLTAVRELTQQDFTGRIQLLKLKIGEEETPGTGWLMDFQKENANHIGNYGYQIEADQVFLHSSFGQKVGDIVTIQFNQIKKIVQLVVNQIKIGGFTGNLQTLQNITVLKAQFRVAGVFQKSYGKFPQGQTAFYAYFNIKNSIQYLLKSSLGELFQGEGAQQSIGIVFNQIENLKLEEFSDRALLNFPNRINLYSDPNFQQISKQINNRTSNIVSKLGPYLIDSEMPILYFLKDMSLLGLFIGVVFKFIMFGLFVLSVLMMYNMFMIGVESNNYCFGILRTIGMKRVAVVSTVLSQGLKYVIVGNLFGIPLSKIILSQVSQVFTQFFGFEYHLDATFDSLIMASIVGFLVPIVASLVPVSVALGQKIIEAINPIRNKSIALKVQTYVEGKDFPVGQFLFGILSCGFGLMIIYFLPQSLIDQNVGMLLSIFFMVLVALLTGLILVAHNFQFFLEITFTKVFLFWMNTTDLLLILKNLAAHRIKNRRAALLYSFSVCLLIFVSVGLSVQLQSIKYQTLSEFGTYVEIRNHKKHRVDKTFYDELLANESFKPYIQDIAYQTHDLWENYLQNQQVFQKVTTSDKARQFFRKQGITGVTPNYFSTLSLQDFGITQTLSTEGLDPVEYLYTKQGWDTCIISEFVRRKTNIDVFGANNEVLININFPNFVRRHKIKVSSVLSYKAGAHFSSFEFLPSDMVVSLDTWMRLANIRSINDIPFRRIKIKLYHKENSSVVATLIRKAITETPQDNKIWDYGEMDETITKIFSLMRSIELIISAVVLLISYFSLVTTTTTNILNQTKQISVMLSIGLTTRRIKGIYIGQTVVLVFTACIVGILAGYILGFTIGMQRQIFGQMPIEVDISGIWFVFLGVLVSAIASTYGPINKLLNRRIAQITRIY